jgi:hypothetical protein
LLHTGVILLVWFDVGTHAPNLSLTAPCSVFEPDAIRQFFKWDNQLRAGVSRARQGAASVLKMTARLSGNMEADTYGRRLSLFLNFNLLDHVPKFDGFFPLDVKEYHDVSQRMYSPTNPVRPLEDFLGVSHVNNPTNSVDWISRDTFLPLVTGGQQPVFADNADTLNAIFSGGFSPLDQVWLPLENRGEVRATGRAGVKILSLHFSPHRLRFETDAGAPAIVVVAQVFYHPWRAYVDGKPVPLWRANYAFQALAIPPGKHQVSVVYEDKTFFWGAVLSLISLLLCAAAWFRWRRNPGEALPSVDPFGEDKSNPTSLFAPG